MMNGFPRCGVDARSFLQQAGKPGQQIKELFHIRLPGLFTRVISISFFKFVQFAQSTPWSLAYLSSQLAFKFKFCHRFGMPGEISIFGLAIISFDKLLSTGGYYVT